MDINLVNTVREKYVALEPFFNERTKRLWAATEAKAIGRGGGTDHDTAEFAVDSIRRWWYKMGRVSYPQATHVVGDRRRRRQ